MGPGLVIGRAKKLTFELRRNQLGPRLEPRLKLIKKLTFELMRQLMILLSVPFQPCAARITFCLMS